MFRLLRFFPTRWWSPRAWRTWREYVHWRMETFGVYYKTNKVDRAAMKMLARQFPSYYRWLGQIDRLRRPSKSL